MQRWNTDSIREKTEICKEKQRRFFREDSGEHPHPLHTFTLENEALAKTIEKCREALKNGHVEYKLIEEVRQLAIHYAKKGDLLYPHLKVKYEISGPSDVMWTVDDEIRDEFAALAKKADSQDDEWKKTFRGGTHKSRRDDL